MIIDSPLTIVDKTSVLGRIFAVTTIVDLVQAYRRLAMRDQALLAPDVFQGGPEAYDRFVAILADRYFTPILRRLIEAIDPDFDWIGGPPETDDTREQRISWLQATGLMLGDYLNHLERKVKKLEETFDELPPEQLRAIIGDDCELKEFVNARWDAEYECSNRSEDVSTETIADGARGTRNDPPPLHGAALLAAQYICRVATSDSEPPDKEVAAVIKLAVSSYRKRTWHELMKHGFTRAKNRRGCRPPPRESWHNAWIEQETMEKIDVRIRSDRSH